MNKPPRVAILHQGCVPNYRAAFYNQLAAKGNIDYVVFWGTPEPGSGVIAADPSTYTFHNQFVRNRFFKIAGRSLIYQPVLRQIIGGDFDALVIGHEIKYVANLVLLFWFWLVGKPVLFWGFGTLQDFWDEKRGRFGRLLSGIIRWFKDRLIRMAAGFMSYTDSGVAAVVRSGMPRDRITVLYNTIDLSDEIAGHAKAQALDRAELRRNFGISPDAVVFTFVGRLLAGKKVEELIRVVRELRADPAIEVEVVIVGDGPERKNLEAEAAGAPWCHFLGGVHDVEPISRIFRVSDALVIPGYVGLAVNRAFAHGLPLITMRSNLHSPEIDYVVEGGNGLMLEPGDGFREGLRRFAADPALRAHLAEGALATREKLDLGRMVAAFDGAVATALARAKRK